MTPIFMLNRTDKSQRVGQSVRITFEIVSKVLGPVLSCLSDHHMILALLVNVILVENEVLITNDEWVKIYLLPFGSKSIPY